MKIIEKISGMNETLLDLVLGCLVYSLVFEVIGLVLIPQRIQYTLGLSLGTLSSVCCAFSMAFGIDRMLDMDQRSAARNNVFHSILRMIFMLVLALIGAKIGRVSLYGVIIGMIGLKISAHMHVYTNVYITKKIRRKGR